jgi:serine/threonine protein kinase
LIGEAPFKEEISNWKKRGGQKSNSWNWRIIYPAELSENAIAFMKNLLKENPNERVSITSALSSKFIKERKKENEHLAEYELNFLSLG